MKVDLYYHRDSYERSIRIGDYDFDLHGEEGYTTKLEVERKKAALKNKGLAVRIKTVKLQVERDNSDKPRYQSVFIIYTR